MLHPWSPYEGGIDIMTLLTSCGGGSCKTISFIFYFLFQPDSNDDLYNRQFIFPVPAYLGN